MKKIFLCLSLLFTFVLLSCNQRVRICYFGDEIFYKNGDSIIVNHYEESNKFEVVINSDEKMQFYFELGINSDNYNGSIDTSTDSFSYVDSTGDEVIFNGILYDFTGSRTITIFYDDEIDLLLEESNDNYSVHTLGFKFYVNN